MILTKAFATMTVASHERKALLKKNSSQIQIFILVLLCVSLVSVVLARIRLSETQKIEAAQAEAAEVMRLDIEKQEAIRASALAAEKSQHKTECEAIAKVLYGTALHHSEDAQRAVVWCILNRVDSTLYPNSVEEVCSQPSQWMGFDDNNPVISSLYDISDEVLSYWKSGGYRPMSPDYLFLTWTQDEIILRTTFKETKNTHYWSTR